MMTSQRILNLLVTVYQRGERLVLVFDYDGTLTPLVARVLRRKSTSTKPGEPGAPAP